MQRKPSKWYVAINSAPQLQVIAQLVAEPSPGSAEVSLHVCQRCWLTVKVDDAPAAPLVHILSSFLEAVLCYQDIPDVRCSFSNRDPCLVNSCTNCICNHMCQGRHARAGDEAWHGTDVRDASHGGVDVITVD